MRPFWLASFIWHNLFTVHPCCSMYWYFILFYDPIRSRCVDKLHVVCPLLIHVDGQADCFYILAFINNVARNICVQGFVWRGMFKSLGRGLPSHMLLFTFEKLLYCFPQQLPTLHSPATYEGFGFSTFSSALV